MVFQPVEETMSKDQYFESTLQFSYDLCPKYKLEGYAVPSIIYQCITFLHNQSGEGFEGIFRLNGMMSEVKKIQEIFNKEFDCNLAKLSPIPDVHSVATLLKRYMRNIQDRVIVNEVNSELGHIINNNLNDKSNTQTKGTLITQQGVEAFKMVFLTRIETLNKNVIFVLFKYLMDVLRMGKHNKMSINAMSVLIGPNLTKNDGGGQICTILLENFDFIFEDYLTVQ